MSIDEILYGDAAPEMRDFGLKVFLSDDELAALRLTLDEPEDD